MIGKSMAVIISPDHRKEVDIMTRVRLGERIDRFETVGIRKDGALLELIATVWPIFDEQGSVIGASMLAQNVTGQKTSEMLARRMVSVLLNSDECIASENLDGVVETWNRGAERMFGYLADEIIGKPMALLLPPDRLHEEDLILSRIRKGDTVDRYETVRKCKDGRLIYVSATISPMFDHNGKVGSPINKKSVTMTNSFHEESSFFTLQCS